MKKLLSFMFILNLISSEIQAAEELRNLGFCINFFGRSLGVGIGIVMVEEATKGTINKLEKSFAVPLCVLSLAGLFFQYRKFSSLQKRSSFLPTHRLYKTLSYLNLFYLGVALTTSVIASPWEKLSPLSTVLLFSGLANIANEIIHSAYERELDTTSDEGAGSTATAITMPLDVPHSACTETTCPICWESYTELVTAAERDKAPTPKRTILACGHMTCNPCLVTSLRDQTITQHACPICRAAISRPVVDTYLALQPAAQPQVHTNGAAAAE